MAVHAVLPSLGTTLPGCLSTLHRNSPLFKSCHPQFTITDLSIPMGCSKGLSHSPRFGFSSSRVLPNYDFGARNITRIPQGRPYPMAGPQAREGPMSNSIVEEVLNTTTSLYPVYMAIGGFIACTKPSAFAWFVKRAPASYILSLGIVMLAMGLKLELQDLINVLLRRPFAVLFGCFAHYSILPLSGTIVSRALGLSPELSVGLILLSCCPVGSASSVVTLISKGDVPLSILTTVCSTLAAVFITPLLTKFLAGAFVPVDAGNLALSTLQVVVVPVLAGSCLQSICPGVVKFISPFSPLFAVLISTLLSCSVLSANINLVKSSVVGLSGSLGLAQIFRGQLAIIISSVVLIHAAGYIFGYLVAAISGFGESQRRAISIEVGMLNSALGVVLASTHFDSPLIAVPAAISAVIMNIMGSTLGFAWKHIDLPYETSREEG